MEKISVIIITKNEEENIEDCLNSVVWADEIIVVDSESKDGTVETAKKFTGKIFSKKWEGFAKQKRYALGLASNELVLNLDADERVSDKLRDEIGKMDFSSEGYFIPRENYFLNKKITTCGWEKDFQLRLFKKSKVKVTEKLIHEGFVVKGKTDYLKNPVIHYTFTSIEKSFSKINNYSTLQALEVFRTKQKVTSWTIISHGLSAFLRYYFSLKGYKDGIHGLMISLFNSITTLLTYMKIWEYQNFKKN
ncbi:MAG: glycosyltransferase family 2 protein [Ignavibacteriaceae bacterium]